jgi:hypothetical protein
MNLPAGVPVTSQSIRVWFESSLGKVNILLSIAATSTISVLSLCGVLDFGSMCYLIRRRRQVLIASVCFAVRNGIAPMGLPQWNCPNGIAPMELSSVQTTWFGRFGGPITSDSQSPDPPLPPT